MEFTVAFLFCQSQNKFHLQLHKKCIIICYNKYYFFLFVLQTLTQNLYCQNLQVFFFFFLIHIKNNNKDEEKTKMFNIDQQKKKPFPPFNIYFFFFGKLFSLETLTASPFLKYYSYRQENMLCFLGFFCYTMYINSYAARILLPLTHQPTKYRYTPAYN